MAASAELNRSYVCADPEIERHRTAYSPVRSASPAWLLQASPPRGSECCGCPRSNLPEPKVGHVAQGNAFHGMLWLSVSR